MRTSSMPQWIKSFNLKLNITMFKNQGLTNQRTAVRESLEMVLIRIQMKKKCLWSPFPIGYKLSIFESFKLFNICWCNNEIKFFCSLTFFAATNVRCRTSLLQTSRRNNLDAILILNILTPCYKSASSPPTH